MNEKTMRLRYPGRCRQCGADLTAGTTAVYDRDSKTVCCVRCPHAPAATAVVNQGVAGASATREYQRRSERREQRIRSAHPRLGGLILALSEEPQSTRAWAVGAAGERRLAATLDAAAERGVRLLHDRRIPRTRANIDHIAVSEAGVFVIDAKHYRGRPRAHTEGGLLRPRVTTLRIGSRDGTRLVAGVHKQVALVRDALADVGIQAPVHGMLCFVAADWPVIGGAFVIDGVSVLWPKKAVEVILGDRRWDPARIDVAHRALAALFPVA